MYGENNRPAMFKMELDGFRAQMQAMIMDRHADMERCVNAGIDACIASLPEQLANEAKKMSKEIVEEATRKALIESTVYGTASTLWAVHLVGVVHLQMRIVRIVPLKDCILSMKCALSNTEMSASAILLGGMHHDPQSPSIPRRKA